MKKIRPTLCILMICVFLGCSTSVLAHGPAVEGRELYQAIVDEVNVTYGANYVITDFADVITISPDEFEEKLVDLAVALSSDSVCVGSDCDVAELASRSATDTKTLTRTFKTYFQLTATAKYYYEDSGNNRSYYFSTNTIGNTATVSVLPGFYHYSIDLYSWDKYVRPDQLFYEVTIYGDAWVSSGGITVKYDDVNSTFVFTVEDLR